jgi:hypothetical protein
VYDSVVPVIRGDFFVDGKLVDTVLGPRGPYEFGGASNRWDSTTYSDGLHELGFRATDAIGQTCEYSLIVTIDNGMDAGVETDGSAGMDGGSLDAGSDMDGSVGMDAGEIDAGNGMDAGFDIDAAIPPVVDAGRDASAPPTIDAGSGPGDSGAPGSDAETGGSDGASQDAASTDGRPRAPFADASSDGDADVIPAGEGDGLGSGCGCRTAGLGASRDATASVLVLAAAFLLGRRSRSRRAAIKRAP